MTKDWQRAMLQGTMAYVFFTQVPVAIIWGNVDKFSLMDCTFSAARPLPPVVLDYMRVALGIFVTGMSFGEMASCARGT